MKSRRWKAWRKRLPSSADFSAGRRGRAVRILLSGFIMNVLAMKRELEDPDLDEIKEYLAGNLCRCTGYMSQLRAIQKYMAAQKEKSGKEGAGMTMAEERKDMRVVNHAVPKVDAQALVTGKAVYTNDLAPFDSLIVKIVRSPHAHA